MRLRRDDSPSSYLMPSLGSTVGKPSNLSSSIAQTSMALTVFGGRPPTSIIAQLSDSWSSSDSDRFDGFPIARWRGRCFIEDERLWRKGSRPPKTWIKDHGVFLREINQGRLRRTCPTSALPEDRSLTFI